LRLFPLFVHNLLHLLLIQLLYRIFNDRLQLIFSVGFLFGTNFEIFRNRLAGIRYE
jgi:hypothetical protein